MTRTSIREYTEAIRERYLRAPRKEKSKILDEFTKVTGYHRKSAIRLLHQTNKPRANKKRGDVPESTVQPWSRHYGSSGRLLDRLCSKRLQPFLPELVNVLRRHDETTMSAEVETQLCQIAQPLLTGY